MINKMLTQTFGRIEYFLFYPQRYFHLFTWNRKWATNKVPTRLTQPLSFLTKESKILETVNQQSGFFSIDY